MSSYLRWHQRWGGKLTKVINLFGSPNSGKSVAAAGLYYNLKIRHYNCEMVREYVKNWIWEGRHPSQFDQPYIFGQQLKHESMLYGKVDLVITDSPLILAAFYENLFNNVKIIESSAKAFLEHAESKGVSYVNFWLPTVVEHIDERGREITPASTIKGIEKDMKEWLISDMGLQLIDVDCALEERIQYMLDVLSIA